MHPLVNDKRDRIRIGRKRLLSRPTPPFYLFTGMPVYHRMTIEKRIEEMLSFQG
jgi:hypothetical protein